MRSTVDGDRRRTGQDADASRSVLVVIGAALRRQVLDDPPVQVVLGWILSVGAVAAADPGGSLAWTSFAAGPEMIALGQWAERTTIGLMVAMGGAAADAAVGAAAAAAAAAVLDGTCPV